MRRFFIVLGDKTTSGGTVLEGESRALNHGTPLSYHGARVYCPACNSEGHIVGDGPSWPMLLHGKQVALEDDLCICKCNPPPRLLRSQTNASMLFEGHELTRMSAGAGAVGTQPFAGSRARYIAFKLPDTDEFVGFECIAHFDDGSTVKGTFDSQNRVRFENPSGTTCKRVTLTPYTRKSGSTFCAAILNTLTA
ncbi:PAAR domain-containing protein [Burkholderia ubonensis]|uniref:PAAR domain-containing protein n=1 Tax=Burkholderia ubonensis TaxID=101571 RepID=UPI000BA78C85|nr:PAAR domain-containing protein [Burkholderia ubonensis]PAK13859.1 hypothetical protein CJO66_12810 [Burkholderia ubonensis]RQP38514.1 PAAR domain-containing protein [Burkholderia ubonensis]RQP39514.1 PAAR domain-containing protein [Burkholderia ubonensis]RQP39813.1 PAAR domain-containing protein [Burkholderia ubonensis]RQP52902.1 PAAR domain-containing protein [Burkholderia ubonensis]